MDKKTERVREKLCFTYIAKCQKTVRIFLKHACDIGDGMTLYINSVAMP